MFWLKAERIRSRRLSTAATLVLLGLLVLFAGVNSAILAHGQFALRTNAAMEDIYRQISVVQSAVESIHHAETGQRGFLLTENPLYLQTYEAGVSATRAKLASLPAAAA